MDTAHPEHLVHPGTVDTECTPSAGSPQDHGCRVHPERLVHPGPWTRHARPWGGIRSSFPAPSPEHTRQHGNVPHPRPLPSWAPPLRPSGARTSPTRIGHPGPASSGKSSSPRELPQDGGQEPGTGRQSLQSLRDLTSSSFYGEIKHRPGHWVTTGAKLHSQTPEPVLSRIGSWIQPFLLWCLRPRGRLRVGTEGLAVGTVASSGGLTPQRELGLRGSRDNPKASQLWGKPEESLRPAARPRREPRGRGALGPWRPAMVARVPRGGAPRCLLVPVGLGEAPGDAAVPSPPAQTYGAMTRGPAWVEAPTRGPLARHTPEGLHLRPRHAPH